MKAYCSLNFAETVAKS